MKICSGRHLIDSVALNWWAAVSRFRFKNKLLSLDSTTISLCLSLFPWAEFKTVKGGIKTHVLLDHDDYLPRFVLITTAKYPDVKAAHLLSLESRFDCRHGPGLHRLQTLRQMDKAGIFFVTRLRNDLNWVVSTKSCCSSKPQHPCRTKRFASTANGAANIVGTCSFDASLFISTAKNLWFS